MTIPPNLVDARLAAVFRVIAAAEPLGTRTTGAGARLIGHVPHVAPEAYLHTTFASLADPQISALEAAIGRPIPASYRELLGVTNGLSLFSGSLNVYGLRASYTRVGDAAWQPFSAIEPNTLERPRGLPREAVIVGGYSGDGSLVYVRADDSVARCDRDVATSLNEWPHLFTMLATEAERFVHHFDAQGRPMDGDDWWTPPPGPQAHYHAPAT